MMMIYHSKTAQQHPVTGVLLSHDFKTIQAPKKTHIMENDFDAKDLIATWEAIGLDNPWIAEANDPPFSKYMLVRVASLAELEYLFEQGNWCLGQGYYFKNLCFINQINGGDEWLTIKDDYAFESVTFNRIIKQGEFVAYIESLLNATKEQCINLEY